MPIFLHKYYKKKIHSILTIFEKQVSGMEMEDIHRLRVSIKKVRAVFQLFEIIAPKDFKTHSEDIFNSAFKNAGKIRELQINRNYLKQYNLTSSNALPYVQFTKQREKKLTDAFKNVAEDFDLNCLKKINGKVKQICIKTSQKKIIKKSNKFITDEAQKIKKLKSNVDNTYKTHKLRKHLRSLDAIVTLLFHTEKNKNHKKLLSSVKQAGIVLGDWHDKEVLINSLENFIAQNKNGDMNKFLPLNKLITRISIENQRALRKSIPKINSVLQKSLQNHNDK